MLQNNINVSSTTRNRSPPNRPRITKANHEILDSSPNTPDKAPNEDMDAKSGQILARNQQQTPLVQPGIPRQAVSGLRHGNYGGNPPVHQTAMVVTNQHNDTHR